MPRHLTSDAHEWINEISTVPMYYLANLQPRERAWDHQRGKKTLDDKRGLENSTEQVIDCRNIAAAPKKKNLFDKYHCNTCY